MCDCPSLCRTVISGSHFPFPMFLGLHFIASTREWPWVQPHQRPRAPRLQPQSQDKSRHGQARGSRHTTLRPRLCQERDSLGRASPKTKVSYYCHLNPNVFTPSNKHGPEIQRDAKGPHLLANLSRLNPVQVHHHRPPVETVSFKVVSCRGHSPPFCCSRFRFFLFFNANCASEAKPRQGVFRIALEGGG